MHGHAADGQRGDDRPEHRVREVAGDVDRQDHRIEEAGRGAQERDGELHHFAASIRDVLLDNENYTKCALYKRLERDIERYIARTIWNMKRNGEIRKHR